LLTLRGLGTHGMLKRRGGHDGDRLPLNAVTARKAGRWGDEPLSGATRPEVGRGPTNDHGNGRLAPTQDFKTTFKFKTI
jgi:hypothetical protein